MRLKEPEKAENLAFCAFQLFSERGINQVNMDAIAAEAGVTKGSVYHHFRSKKEVILKACECYYSRWYESTHEETLKEDTFLGKLEKAIQFSVRSCLLDRKNRVFTLEILTLSLYDEDVLKSWAAFYKRAHGFYLDLLKQAIATGEIVDLGDPEDRVDVMLRTMEGVKQQAHFDKKICTDESEALICTQLLKMLTHG